LKVIKRYIILSLAVLLSIGNLFGQNLIEDFKKINARYGEKAYQMSLTYNYYSELTSKSPEEVQTAEVRKDGNKYYLKAHGMETIISEGVFLQVHQQSKVILLDSARPSYYQNLTVQLDSLAQLYKGAAYQKLDSITAQYKIPSKAAGIAYTLVAFNSITFEIKQITVQFLDIRKTAKEGTLRNKLVITYDKVNFNPVFTTESFSHSKYLYKKENTYHIKSAYKHYRLVNNLKNYATK